MDRLADRRTGGQVDRWTGWRTGGQMYSVIVEIKHNRKYATSDETARHQSALISVVNDANFRIYLRRKE